jgi:hypothetical protein
MLRLIFRLCRLQTPSRLYIWIGAQCPESHAVAAKAVAGILPKYEAALMPGLVTGAGSAVEVPVYHQVRIGLGRGVEGGHLGSCCYDVRVAMKACSQLQAP